MKKKFCLIVLLVGITLYANSQSIYLWQNNSIFKTYITSNVGKLSFSNGNLQFSLNTGETELYSLSTVQKVSFNAATTSTAQITVNGNTLYYQPVSESVFIKNTQKGKTTLAVYKANGTLIITRQLTEGDQSVDVSSLPTGFYIIRVNGQVLKFVK